MNAVRKNEIIHKLIKVPYVRRINKFIKRFFRKPNNAYDDVELNCDIGIKEDISLEGANKILIEWPNNVGKPYVGLVRESNVPGAYWPKYERFLKNNNIKYDYYEVDKSDFIEEGKKFDIIIWRTPNEPAKQDEAASKIRILQNHLGKICLPSEEELWFYENKINQYYIGQVKGLPMIETFISNSEVEAMEYIRKCKYPVVSKVTTGSSSQGVKLIKNARQASKMCKKVFENGLSSCWTYVKQKNYVYFQQFIPNAKYDLRIIVIGNSFFGYYRQVPKDDFRASGSGIEIFDEVLPEEAMLLAKEVKMKYIESRMLAVDLLKDQRDGKFYIIETTIFPGVYFPSETIINGKLGRYVYENGKFNFEPGRFWVQELALQEVMNEWIHSKK